MKRIKNFVIGGIENKVFNLVLITIILIVGAFSGVVLYQSGKLTGLVDESNQKQQETIREISGRTMDSIIDGTVVRTTGLEAYIANGIFEEVSEAVELLADYAQVIFSDPEAFEPQKVVPPNPSQDGKAVTQLLSAEGVDPSDPALQDEIGLAANMSRFMTTLFNKMDVDSCFIGLPSGIFLIADAQPGRKFSSDGSLMPINVTRRPWYTGAVEAKGMYFTDVETDNFTGEIGICCSMPVYVEGELAAVVGCDLFLDSMQTGIASLEEDSGFVCVINQEGRVIFSPKTTGTFSVLKSSEAADLRESEDEELAEFVKAALQGDTDIHLVQAEGKEWYMAASPLSTVGWVVVRLVDKEMTDMPMQMMQEQHEEIVTESRETFRNNISHARTMILVLLGMICVIACAASISVSKRIVRPLNTITKRITTLGGDHIQFQMEDVYRTGDEIEVLAESFADISRKTVHYMEEIRRVTAEKERIDVELSMANAIQASQLPNIFPAYPERDEFDIYATMKPTKEVGGDFYDFFLSDPEHLCMVMADVSGKGIPAALFMMIAKTLIKNRIQGGESLGEAIANVNNQLLEGNEMNMFVTVWICRINLETGKGTALNAGHEHPALRRKGGRYELVLYRHCAAVAAFENMPFKEHEFELHPGDSIFVYTDGVPEAANGKDELFGTDRMLEALNKDPNATLRATLKNVADSIEDFADGADQFDDLTMLGFTYNGPRE